VGSFDPRHLEIFSDDAKLFFDNRIPGEWLSTKEAAAYLRSTPNALRILVHRGKLRAFKFGRQLRFRMPNLLVLIEKRGA